MATAGLIKETARGGSILTAWPAGSQPIQRLAANHEDFVRKPGAAGNVRRDRTGHLEAHYRPAKRPAIPHGWSDSSPGMLHFAHRRTASFDGL
jgi:hypothetical protein